MRRSLGIILVNNFMLSFSIIEVFKLKSNGLTLAGDFKVGRIGKSKSGV